MATDTAGGSLDSSDFPEEGGPGDTLNPSESLDSDEVRNDDGDIVVNPPEGWSGVDKFGITGREEREGESLDGRLAAEEPDAVPEELTEVDRIDRPARVHRGQVSGTPEDGESLFEVLDEGRE